MELVPEDKSSVWTEEIREKLNNILELYEEMPDKPLGISEEIPEEILKNVRRTDRNSESMDEILESLEKTLEHTNEMLDGLVGIYETSEYRRKHGDIAYRRKYFGDMSGCNGFHW